MRELKRYNTFEELGNWYNDKYNEMGDGWDCPEDIALEYISFANIDSLNHEDNLLDIGCGAGHFIKIASRFVLCMGVDISDVAIEKARRRSPEAIFYTMKLEDIPDNYSFNIITSIGSLEHTLDIPVALNKIHNLLKDNGTFFALVPNEKWLHMDQPNETTYTNEEWEQLFKNANFKIIKLQDKADLSLFLMKKL